MDTNFIPNNSNLQIQLIKTTIVAISDERIPFLFSLFADFAYCY